MTDRHHRYENLGAIPRGMLEETARTYAVVFAAQPWNECWEHDRVVQKIAREIDRESAALGKDRVSWTEAKPPFFLEQPAWPSNR